MVEVKVKVIYFTQYPTDACPFQLMPIWPTQGSHPLAGMEFQTFSGPFLDPCSIFPDRIL